MICAYKIHHTNTSQLIWNNNIRSTYVGIIRVGSGKYPISKLGLESAENGLFSDFLRFPAPKVYTNLEIHQIYQRKWRKIPDLFNLSPWHFQNPKTIPDLTLVVSSIILGAA